ncbi:hypothetical protein FAZ69_02490 [Trinickia terrae]|uniref:Uncharacterized protein n=1 Tax=Trinickia terrae TaxID=2571161 RepID=A0A4U1IFQ8_9BURK|nr:hypothetical protein [Trinickia terrae]TKC92558.1 hypothetical protein FAZ69_02490 [Trinickia terrae]
MEADRRSASHGGGYAKCIQYQLPSFDVRIYCILIRQTEIRVESVLSCQLDAKPAEVKALFSNSLSHGMVNVR